MEKNASHLTEEQTEQEEQKTFEEGQGGPSDRTEEKAKKIQKKEKEPEQIYHLPMIPIRDLVLFPGMILQFEVGREGSLLAVNQAIKGDRLIFLSAQKKFAEERPDEKDIFKVGVIAKVKQVLQRSEEEIKLHVEGLYRGRIQEILSEGTGLTAKVVRLYAPGYRKSAKSDALTRIIREKLDEYSEMFRHLPPDVVMGVMNEKDCGKLADYIASNVSIDFESKQRILEQLHPVKRLAKLVEVMTHEIKILGFEREIHQKTQERVESNQREYYLKEQLRAISSELGDEENPQQEAEEFRERIIALKLEEDSAKKLLKECEKLQRMPYGSHEASVIRVYLDTCLSLPWNQSSCENLNLERAEQILQRDHYGLEKVKERFLETLAVKQLEKKEAGQIICLVGPPGVGKTSIARSIAEAMGREYVRVSLGGVSDGAEIMGHRKTYVGSMPGRIINALRQAGTKNPMILLDEVDKLGQNFKGDPASALLEVLDPEQNAGFTDHYLGLPFSLQDVLFITTANDARQIPGPLYDRMEIIELSSYTLDEKVNIGMQYLVKKQMERHGIEAQQLTLSKSALREIIEGYTKEAGVRTLERQIAAVCRKTAKRIVTEENFVSFSVAPEDLESLLGPRRFSREKMTHENTVGLVNGLAWTSVGGELLPIEVAVLEGSGKIQLTGSLGDVMKESAATAITCIRSRAKRLGIDTDFYKNCDIHIHAPEGAVPKDGPSAGVAMATAITSALCRIPVRGDFAMTGEITLQGRVLPIGGLREKAMAAYKSGMTTVLIPRENEPDIAEVDQVVKDALQFVPVYQIDRVLELALESPVRSRRKLPKHPGNGTTLPSPVPERYHEESRI